MGNFQRVRQRRVEEFQGRRQRLRCVRLLHECTQRVVWDDHANGARKTEEDTE
jgi:hypothetical protein